MNTTTIHIIGADYMVGFDFSVLLQYEEDYNKTLELDNMDTASNQLRLIHSVLRAFNDGYKMSLKDLAHAISAQDMRLANEAILEHLKAFFQTSPIADEHVENTEQEEAKNA